MQRRVRVDLGQSLTNKEENKLERKRKSWAARNKDRPYDNPFIATLKPGSDQYGDSSEDYTELQNRLKNLEYGNFPDYSKYRNVSALKQKLKLTNSTSVKGAEEEKEASLEERNDKKDDEASTELDDRLEHFDKCWFANREVLDIGCNRGHITCSIAKLHRPKLMIGIDIDHRIIRMANRDLHQHKTGEIINNSIEFRLRRAAQQKLSVDKNKNDGDDDADIVYKEDPTHHFPLSTPLISDQSATLEGAPEETWDNKFPNNIIFLEHNYVLARDELVEKQRPHFDTILCLSVTKWIHLNYRDEGLKRFLRRIYHHLTPGGLLILEAQPFDNYARRKRLSDRLRANFYSIKFKPKEFDQYLLGNEVGFKEIIYDSVTDHRCPGFKRPLKVYRK